MIEIGPKNAVEFLKQSGRLENDVDAQVDALAWGVSNVVLRVEPSTGPAMVIKQSREKLRTKATWLSRLDRIYREAAAMRLLADLLPEGVIPRVLFEDRENYLFAMQAIEADHLVWKSVLLEGTVDVKIAMILGRYLATVHRETAGRADLQEEFGDIEVFDQLRIDPFYRRIATVHGEIAPSINRLIDATTESADCIVLGDFSPKNILIRRDGLSLVDFETVVYGDSTFDLGFFLSHLLLKTVLHADQSVEFLQLATSFFSAYESERFSENTVAGKRQSDFDQRTVYHLAACILSRVDGKSPVDYLSSQQQEFVRQFCLDLFRKSVTNVESVFTRLQERL